MDFTANDGLIDLVFDTRDRLMVDCRADRLMNAGVMMAILGPEHCQ
jgi:hypothetical protein